MTQQDRVRIISLKSFLFLIAGVFAVSAALLVILFSLAATVTGGTPFSAVTLAEGVNTGVLAPGEQRWFKYNPDPFGRALDLEKSLTLIFTPDDGNRIRHVTLLLFEEDQLQFFFSNDASKMKNFGAAQMVSRDNNPLTGEQLWHGWLSGQKTYYVQVVNGADTPIDYWLFTEDVESYALGSEPEAPVETVIPELGASPENPAPLMPGLTKGSLEPHSSAWYAFTFVDYTDKDRFKDLGFSMYFTPDDGNRRHYVNFELFPMSEVGVWQRGDSSKMTNFGAGSLEDRDDDNNTGTRVWRGQVVKGITYLLAVENSSDVAVDYWLYDSDVFTPQLGPEPAPQPKPVFVEGAAPETAVPLKFGVNKGGLEPGEEAWYSFRITDRDEEVFEPMALTMVTTPDDGNRIYHMNMDIFTAPGVRYWSPGDNSQINNIGAGSVVFRDDNPLTGEKFWNGWVVDNDLYYVQIRNLAQIHMDYWLFTGDVYRAELGEKTEAEVVQKADPGTAPSAPLAMEVGVNQGQLNPGQDRWYSFSRADFTGGKTSIETAFTVVFTPDGGNRAYKVNVKLFEGSQLRDWAPDNRFGLNGFGQATVVNRDGNQLTGELLWKGHVFPNDVYYLQVANGTDVVIDYHIYPDDVINTSLGE
jgi:hypothetical protein